MLFLFLTSCQNTPSSSTEETVSSLPNEVLETDEAFEKLSDNIYSDNSTIDKSTIEVMSFNYTASLHPSTSELSTHIDVSFVKGDDKNRIVEYSIDNEGNLSNNEVDIKTGELLKQKISNTYETYQPYLFSSEKINLEVLRKVMQESLEKFKKDSNVEKAYCSSIKIEADPNQKPTIGVSITEYKLGSIMRRYYDYTTDGKFIK